MTSSVKSRPKFSIVEGGSFSKEKQEEIYEDFMKDYLSSDIKKSEMDKLYPLLFHKVEDFVVIPHGARLRKYIKKKAP